MKKINLKMLGVIIMFISPLFVFSSEYKVSLAKMPVYAESKEKGVLVELVKAIEEVSNEKMNIKVLPFASSMHMIKKKKVDFHIPLIKNDILDEGSLPFLFSSETIFHVNFVVYSLKNKKLDMNNLSQYNIETDRAHIEYFPFKVNPTNSISKSLKKVDEGKIDAFIFADFATDPLLKKSAFTNLKRELYKVFDVKIVLSKSEKSTSLDNLLTSSINKLKESGKYKKIMDKIDLPYNNWQP